MSENEKFGPSMRAVEQMEAEDAEKFAKVRADLEKRKNQLYVVKVVLRAVEGNDQTADYGDMVFRKWTAGEVMEILADPVYQKANRLRMENGMPQLEPLTLDEQKHIFGLYCDFIARAQPAGSQITREFLKGLDDWAYTRACFGIIASKSGMDSQFSKDMERFFRDG
jgi:hypothetical protein